MQKESLNQTRDQILESSRVSCRDCYRCIRVCPVKAIRVTKGQPHIEEDRCIRCGACVRECFIHVRHTASDFSAVQQYIRGNRFVVASVDPAFPALFQDWRTVRFAAALRELGFTAVHEAAEAVPAVEKAVQAAAVGGGILPNCPAVVNYVEQYFPELTEKLLPVASPMIVHGRMLRQEYGKGAIIVHICPCAAKVYEAHRPEHAGVIDCVITFQELLGWISKEHKDLAALEEVPFDCVASMTPEEARRARITAMKGGLLHSCGYDWDPCATDAYSVSGTQDVTDLLTEMRRGNVSGLVEPLFCHGGCCNGPNFPRRGDTFVSRRAAVLRYAQTAPVSQALKKPAAISAAASYTARPYLPAREIKELEIAEILKKLGHSVAGQQYNCGACGYKTCRERAIAILEGMAEPEMCFPYMRTQLRQRTDRIVEALPCGVVQLDGELRIRRMNRSFEKMFLCNDGVLGKRISYLISDEGFDKLMAEELDIYETVRSKYGIRYHEVVFPMRDENEYVGIYTDISALKIDNYQIDLIKRQTLENAKDLLHQQIAFSQDLAAYIGRNEAKSEALVKQIVALLEDTDTGGGAK